jgi:chromosome segregation ATPase
MVLVANREVANAQDVDGNTPMDLAKEGEYPERDAVIAALNRWVTGEQENHGLTSLNKLPASGNAAKPSTLDEMERKLASNSRGLGMTSVGLDEALPRTVEEKDIEIIRLRQTLAHANDERDGLRQTLAELAEEHDRMKMKSVILGDRLGSLNASLYGMMEQQNTVLNSLRKREDKWTTVGQLRREKMKELLQLEEQDDSEQMNVKDSLLKQTKEMEAIQAVIAAVRAGQ